MMTPEQMARLHARAFVGQGRAWLAGEFADLLESRHVFAVGDARAFALGRVIAGEAELLTIATDPDWQGQGLARACLSRFEHQAKDDGADFFFLEVAEDNIAAIALYRAAGYHQIARRTGYYRRPNGAASDALILRKLAD